MKVTVVSAVLAGGAPVHVIEYVVSPAVTRVTLMFPDSERLPLHPSPPDPPEAKQASAFIEFQVSFTFCPAVWVARSADNVAEGFGTGGESSDTPV